MTIRSAFIVSRRSSASDNYHRELYRR